MSVEYWNKPEPPYYNHGVRFARYQEITFVALPYQYYYVRVGTHSASVAERRGIWSARIDKCDPSGKSALIDGQQFGDASSAFIWAARRLLHADCTCPCLDCIEGTHCGDPYYDDETGALIGECHEVVDERQTDDWYPREDDE